ncbi:MAG: glutaminyl-peptide cyclotransferase, partial [Cellvibrionales bacterium]|nr:glutaminyl-peptide cyclotransferase [Cellvibrionales bacterium]
MLILIKYLPFILSFCLTALVLGKGITPSYDIKASIDLPKDCFTQGFLLHREFIYLSCGHYGKSRIIKLNRQGKVIAQQGVDERYFLEDITIINNQLWAMTWKEKTLFI